MLPESDITLQDFFIFLTGAQGEKGDQGDKGDKGDKGDQGNKGDKGDKGDSGSDGNTPFVNDKGNWQIGDVDTGIPATGADGKDGADGSSAYDLWVKDVTSEEGLENPHSPGTLWDRTKTSVADFWEYLRGVAGADGQDGADGKDGADGAGGCGLPCRLR